MIISDYFDRRFKTLNYHNQESKKSLYGTMIIIESIINSPKYRAMIELATKDNESCSCGYNNARFWEADRSPHEQIAVLLFWLDNK
jgi:hypothetical protein